MSDAPDPVTARLLAIEPAARPPRSTWTFDLSLANEATEARWFLLSQPIDVSLGQPRGTVGAELTAIATDQGPVPVLHLSSANEILAVLLPVGGRLELRGVTLGCWVAGGVTALEVWAVPEVLIDGRPIARTWLAGHALQAPAGSVTADYGARKREHKYMDPTFTDHGVRYTAAEKWSLPLDLTGHALPWVGR